MSAQDERDQWTAINDLQRRITILETQRDSVTRHISATEKELDALGEKVNKWDRRFLAIVAAIPGSHGVVEILHKLLG